MTLDVACFVKVFQHLVTSQIKQEAEHLLNGQAGIKATFTKVLFVKVK